MNNGFYKRRRGVLEHIESGLIDLLEDGIHDYLNLKANLLIGSDSSIPVGVVFTSAPAIHAHCKRVSERTIQRILEHLEEIGWIKTFRAPNQRGNYPVLLCRASIHDQPGSCREVDTPNVNCCHPKCKTLSGREYRVNGEDTSDWRNPVYEPVGQVSPETVNAVLKVARLREVRSETRESRETHTPPVSVLPIAEGFEKFYAAYPKKVARADAEKSWRQVVKPEEVPAILARIEINKLGEWRGKEKRFIPYPATWLRGRRWQDEIQTGGTSDGKSSVGDRMRGNYAAVFGAEKAVN